MSPHLDDAVFSCGSLIVALKEQGYQPVVITVFTKALKDKNSKFTKLFLKKSGFTNQAVFFNKRKKEDAQVLKKLGCKFYHLDFIDIAWRQNQKTSFKEKVLSSSVGIFLYPKAKDIFQLR